MTVITVHSRLLAASTPVCPVVHTGLNWALIAVGVGLIVVILASLSWSILSHELAFRTPKGNDAKGSPSGESAGGHGSVQVPQIFDGEFLA